MNKDQALYFADRIPRQQACCTPKTGIASGILQRAGDLRKATKLSRFQPSRANHNPCLTPTNQKIKQSIEMYIVTSLHIIQIKVFDVKMFNTNDCSQPHLPLEREKSRGQIP